MNVEKKVVYRDGIIYILTIIFLILMIYFGSPNPTNMDLKLINKSSGSVFILLYILYLVFLIFESKNSDSKINRTFNNQSLMINCLSDYQYLQFHTQTPLFTI